jgi:glycosyltransferase involved in cell wall biosynthesis
MRTNEEPNFALEPLVSVVIPAYNGAAFIERTLKSVSSQTYRNLEIIVVNDGSTDNTPDVVTACAATEPRLSMVTIPNGGVARARNHGISIAKGELIAFVDADDLWHPIKIAEQVRAMAGSVGAQFGASYTLHRVIDQNDGILWASRSDICSGPILARHFTGKFVGNGSTLLVRRSAIIDVGGFDPSYADAGIGGCEDLDSELRILAKYQMIGIQAYLVGYRVYPGNMSSNRARMAKSIVETIERHLALHPELPDIVRRYARASTYAWTAEILLATKHFRKSGDAILEIFRNDREAGVKITARLLRRTFQKALRATGLMRQSSGAMPPLFLDVDPLVGVEENGHNSLMKRWIADLEEVDMALSASH